MFTERTNLLRDIMWQSWFSQCHLNWLQFGSASLGYMIIIITILTLFAVPLLASFRLVLLIILILNKMLKYLSIMTIGEYHFSSSVSAEKSKRMDAWKSNKSNILYARYFLLNEWRIYTIKAACTYSAPNWRRRSSKTLTIEIRGICLLGLHRRLLKEK